MRERGERSTSVRESGMGGHEHERAQTTRRSRRVARCDKYDAHKTHINEHDTHARASGNDMDNHARSR